MQANALDDKLYFFLCPNLNEYVTLFLGWLTKEMVLGLEDVGTEHKVTHLEVMAGEHLFIVDVDRPMFLVDSNDLNWVNYTNDNNVLDLFPSGNVPDGVTRTLPFPQEFTAGIEKLFLYQLNRSLYKKANNEWIIQNL